MLTLETLKGNQPKGTPIQPTEANIIDFSGFTDEAIQETVKHEKEEQYLKKNVLTKKKYYAGIALDLPWIKQQ